MVDLGNRFKTSHISDFEVCLATHLGVRLVYEKRKEDRFFENTDIKFVLYFLQEMTGAPLKVCYRAMERAKKRGYLEYSVSLTDWLTKKGKKLLFCDYQV